MRRSTKAGGFALLEIVAVAVIMATAMTVVVTSIGSFRQTSRKVLRTSDRYSVLGDFVDTLRRDMNESSSVDLRIDDETGDSMAVICKRSGEVAYVIGAGMIERSTHPGDTVSGKVWEMDRSEVSLRMELAPTGQSSVLHVRVLWYSLGQKQGTPIRQFDYCLRSTGELPNAQP